MQTLNFPQRDRAKQTYTTRTHIRSMLREEQKKQRDIEEAKYHAEVAVKKLVELVGQTEAKRTIQETNFLPF